ncbi:hypothetical protein [Arthrobacter sp. SDTb3-6]|uniref:hypothetical protein n=1 Tax=Arthrobacter sp. SDTb3-6 TaxID=2713571 RepID=UPI00159E9C97|nr:hypothetical protein [Arthrobacter sp. SDTb3-6]NVM97802.1 hypothetical protein [Arthrobacter sp. SDTb3-6]
MNLTVEQLVERAIKALESGQPGLAVLYMRRALVLLAVDRTVGLVQVASSALEALVSVFSFVGESVVSVIDAFIEGVKALSNVSQQDFILVGES